MRSARSTGSNIDQDLVAMKLEIQKGVPPRYWGSPESAREGLVNG